MGELIDDFFKGLDFGDKITLKIDLNIWSYSKVKGGKEKLEKYEPEIRDYIVEALMEDGQVLQYLERVFDRLKVDIQEKEDKYTSYVYAPSPDRRKVMGFSFKIENDEFKPLNKYIRKKKILGYE